MKEVNHKALTEFMKYVEKKHNIQICFKDTIDSKYKPQGYNIGWNVGNVRGQEILHAHLHVIPRYKDEPMSGKGIRYWLKQPQNKRSR